eukprot:745697-Hanusia_phi.AAC.1
MGTCLNLLFWWSWSWKGKGTGYAEIETGGRTSTGSQQGVVRGVRRQRGTCWNEETGDKDRGEERRGDGER